MASSGNSEMIDRELAILTAAARKRNGRKLQASLLIAALIGLLLWKTQWQAIQPGLMVLLAGQLGLTGFLVWRNSRLAGVAALETWFSNEESALRRSSWIENGSRLLGFALLALGFWRSTGNLVLALGLGIVYPAIVYWGLARITARRETYRLEAQKLRLQGLVTNPVKQ